MSSRAKGFLLVIKHGRRTASSKDQGSRGKVAGFNGLVEQTLGWKRTSNYILGQRTRPLGERVYDSL